MTPCQSVPHKFFLTTIVILFCILLISLVHLDKLDIVPNYVDAMGVTNKSVDVISSTANRNAPLVAYEEGGLLSKNHSHERTDSTLLEKSPATNTTYLDQDGEIGRTAMSTMTNKKTTYHWYWVSLRKYWVKRMTFPIRYECENGTVILDKADISSRRGVRGDDVIIFAGGISNDRLLWERLKKTRNPNQLWVFNTDESPLTTMEYIPPRKYRNKIKFNVTFTHHSLSDISTPYGQFIPYNNPHVLNESGASEINYHSHRPKFVAWMSSHCSTISWDRTRFVQDLSSHIPIDMFGKCGNLECPRKGNACSEVLKQYKFILAFENSCCPEYITEKFWNVLNGTENVPVVIGASKEDYERMGPPDSFVYAGDFESMDSLADYLKKVAEDQKLYNSFFKWKSTGHIRQTDFSDRRIVYRNSMCHLLDFVKNQRNSQQKSVGEGWDLYNSSWLGGCKGCSHKEWIRKYNNSPGTHFTFN